MLTAGAETPAWYLRCQRGLGGRGWGLRHVAPLAGNSASSATHNRPPSTGDTAGAAHVRQIPRRTWHCRRPYCRRYLWASRLHSLHPRTPVLLKSSLSGVAVVTRPEATRFAWVRPCKWSCVLFGPRAEHRVVPVDLRVGRYAMPQSLTLRAPPSALHREKAPSSQGPRAFAFRRAAR